MLLRFLTAMGLSNSRHMPHNEKTKTLPGLWDKLGSISRANISSEELVYVSCLLNIGQYMPRVLLSFFLTGNKPLGCCL